jgi:hypothetical protein
MIQVIGALVGLQNGTESQVFGLIDPKLDKMVWLKLYFGPESVRETYVKNAPWLQQVGSAIWKDGAAVTQYQDGAATYELRQFEGANNLHQEVFKTSFRDPSTAPWLCERFIPPLETNPYVQEYRQDWEYIIQPPFFSPRESHTPDNGVLPYYYFMGVPRVNPLYPFR